MCELKPKWSFTKYCASPNATTTYLAKPWLIRLLSSLRHCLPCSFQPQGSVPGSDRCPGMVTGKSRRKDSPQEGFVAGRRDGAFYQVQPQSTIPTRAS